MACSATLLHDWTELPIGSCRQSRMATSPITTLVLGLLLFDVDVPVQLDGVAAVLRFGVGLERRRDVAASGRAAQTRDVPPDRHCLGSGTWSAARPPWAEWIVAVSDAFSVDEGLQIIPTRNSYHRLGFPTN